LTIGGQAVVQIRATSVCAPVVILSTACDF
jgi:hypothetical protein